MSREEQVEEVVEQPQFTIDIDNLPKQQHRWVNRGLKFTCETTTHPTHEAWVRRTI